MCSKERPWPSPSQQSRPFYPNWTLDSVHNRRRFPNLMSGHALDVLYLVFIKPFFSQGHTAGWPSTLWAGRKCCRWSILFLNKNIHYDEHRYVLLSDGDHHIMPTHVDYNVVSSLRRHYALLIEDGGLIDGLSLGQHCALYRSTQLPIGRICYLYVWEHSSPDQSNLILWSRWCFDKARTDVKCAKSDIFWKHCWWLEMFRG